MVRLIQRLPFLPVVAVIFGWAAGTVVLAMPASDLDDLIGSFGSAWLPLMLHPPLSPVGRFVCACLVALAVCVVLLLPARILQSWHRAKRAAISVPNWPGPMPNASIDRAAPEARVQVADPLPNFLGAGPVASKVDGTDEFLLEETMRLSVGQEGQSMRASGASALGAAESDLTAQSPVVLRQPDPVYICEPAPVRPPAPTVSQGRGEAEPATSVVELLDRMERGLADRRRQHKARSAQLWPMAASFPVAGVGPRPH